MKQRCKKNFLFKGIVQQKKRKINKILYTQSNRTKRGCLIKKWHQKILCNSPFKLLKKSQRIYNYTEFENAELYKGNTRYILYSCHVGIFGGKWLSFLPSSIERKPHIRIGTLKRNTKKCKVVATVKWVPNVVFAYRCICLWFVYTMLCYVSHL